MTNLITRLRLSTNAMLLIQTNNLKKMLGTILLKSKILNIHQSKKKHSCEGSINGTN